MIRSTGHAARDTIDPGRVPLGDRVRREPVDDVRDDPAVPRAILDAEGAERAGAVPAAGTSPSADELVADYLEHGEPADPGAWIARLDGAPERTRFGELLEGARLARALLPRLPLPETLLAGRYRVIERIAEGGQGGVFLADDQRLDRRVAIKVLGTASQGDPAHEALLEKESRLLAALDHPGIVAVHELARDGGLSFLVMEFVPGRSLADVIERARTALSVGEARDGELLERAIGACAAPGRTALIEGCWWRSVAHVMEALARTIEASSTATSSRAT